MITRLLKLKYHELKYVQKRIDSANPRQAAGTGPIELLQKQYDGGLAALFISGKDSRI